MLLGYIKLSMHLMILSWDVVIAVLSVLSGYCLLKKKKSSWIVTAFAGGAGFVHALFWIWLLGKDVALAFLNKQVDVITIAAASRVLFSGAQLVAWTCALRIVLKDQVASGLPAAYASHSRKKVTLSAAVAAGIESLILLLGFLSLR
jgi:hypothetical protein